MKTRIIIILAVLALLISWCAVYTPLFSNEVITITIYGGMSGDTSVITIYSNRIIAVNYDVVDKVRGIKAVGLFSAVKRLSKSLYTEIIENAEALSNSDHITKRHETTILDGVVFSLRVNDTTYRTTFHEGDNELDDIVRTICQAANVTKYSLDSRKTTSRWSW